MKKTSTGDKVRSVAIQNALFSTPCSAPAVQYSTVSAPTAQRSKRKFSGPGWRPLDSPGPYDAVSVCSSNVYRRNARAREHLKAGLMLPQAHHPGLSAEVRSKFSSNVALTGHPRQEGVSFEAFVPAAIEFEHYRPRTYGGCLTATYTYFSGGVLPKSLPSVFAGHISKPIVLSLSAASLLFYDGDVCIERMEGGLPPYIEMTVQEKLDAMNDMKLARTVLHNSAGAVGKDGKLHHHTTPVTLVPTHVTGEFCVDGCAYRPAAKGVKLVQSRGFHGLHEFAFVAAAPENARLLKEGRENNMHISHLCDNSGCFNPRHLVLESASKNMSRLDCQKYGLVERDGGYEWTCTHSPPCLITRHRPRGKRIDVAEAFLDAGKDFLGNAQS